MQTYRQHRDGTSRTCDLFSYTILRQALDFDVSLPRGKRSLVDNNRCRVVGISARILCVVLYSCALQISRPWFSMFLIIERCLSREPNIIITRVLRLLFTLSIYKSDKSKPIMSSVRKSFFKFSEIHVTR